MVLKSNILGSFLLACVSTQAFDFLIHVRCYRLLVIAILGEFIWVSASGFYGFSYTAFPFQCKSTYCRTVVFFANSIFYLNGFRDMFEGIYICLVKNLSYDKVTFGVVVGSVIVLGFDQGSTYPTLQCYSPEAV